ncbi:uncharacterized protein [Procambarus clarkii]|uniref:uncharacterized protein n=1 Tax=Procambarus clarkii TaxID=6728 RepID=UPI00374224DB
MKIYNPPRRRCYKCQRWNHVARNCWNDERCGHCAGKHATSVCDAKKGGALKLRCANCHMEGVPAWHEDCASLPPRRAARGTTAGGASNHPGSSAVPPPVTPSHSPPLPNHSNATASSSSDTVVGPTNSCWSGGLDQAQKISELMHTVEKQNKIVENLTKQITEQNKEIMHQKTMITTLQDIVRVLTECRPHHPGVPPCAPMRPAPRGRPQQGVSQPSHQLGSPTTAPHTPASSTQCAMNRGKLFHVETHSAVDEYYDATDPVNERSDTEGENFVTVLLLRKVW